MIILLIQEMGEAKQQQVVKSPCLPTNCHAKYEDHWETIKGEGEGEGEGGVCISSSQENSSINSIGSTFSSSDMADDASSHTSSSCSSSSSNSTSPLFELADLMANLPIKRGLSKYYEGKSQSFTSLSNVSCIEDLVKKGVPYRRKLKASRSCGNGLDLHKRYTLPKAIISKKVSRRGSVTSLSFPSGRNSFLTSTRPPLVPVQKKF